MEMVVNGVSTRKVSHIVEELCERQIFKSTVSELSKGLSEEVNQFKDRPLALGGTIVSTNNKSQMG